MYKIETVYNLLEQLVKDIDNSIVVKFRIMDPEASPAVLFGLPHIESPIIEGLSDTTHKTLKLTMQILVRGNVPLLETRIYEDFRVAFINDMQGLLDAANIKCDYIELGDFGADTQMYGNIGYEVLSGQLRFNIEL